MKLNLVLRTGARSGERVPLTVEEPLLIGRSRRGLNLPDPLVSLQHAEVTWVESAFVVEDLGSKTGTFVNGARIEGKVALNPGDQIQVGETLLEVNSGAMNWKLIAGLSLVPITLMGLTLAAAAVMSSFQADVLLRHHTPIRTPQGEHRNLPIPYSFLRMHGLEPSELGIRRVTDFDSDGLHEVWLFYRDREYLVRYLEGQFSLAGEFPKGCADLGAGDTFPDLRCNGTLFRMGPQKYSVIRQEGIVAWLPQEDGDRSKLTPVRMVFPQDDPLAGFLASRGVTSPIHYLMCDDFLEGMPAQVLLENGKTQQLSAGCINAVRVTGKGLPENHSNRPLAVAFTHVGYEALHQNVANHLLGGVDAPFGTPSDQAWVQGLLQTPVHRLGGLELVVDGSQHIFDPVSRAKRPKNIESLQANGGPTNPRTAQTSTLLAEGIATVETEGCERFELEVGDYRCGAAKGCFTPMNFVRVREVGCGEPRDVLKAPYQTGVFRGQAGPYELAVQVLASGPAVNRDVLNARFSYRLAAGQIMVE